MAALYDTIGAGYNHTRRADTYIAGRLFDLLQPRANGLYLDIGCGTGNYLSALTEKGLRFCGVDPSETMLEKAKQGVPGSVFICASASKIPLAGNYFDGAMAVLTIHHWPDISAGLAELHRVLKPGSAMVFFSFSPEQMKNYWLYRYFPIMIERCMKLIPTVERMEELLVRNGFVSIETEKYFVTNDLTDHFMYSNKYRPEQYLIPEVRNNASAFASQSDASELRKGLSMLEADIASGNINEVIRSFENDTGDYLFIKAINADDNGR